MADNNVDLTLCERLFATIPLLHDQLVKPFETLFRKGLSPMQFYTLLCLERNGSMTMTELAEYFCISKQQMTKIINRLEELSLAQRRSHPGDGRLIQVELTAQGRLDLDQYHSVLTSHLQLSLSALSPEDRQALLGALDKVREILPKVVVPPITVP